ncbi:oligosaccharide flippase family protein [Vibrio sp. VB16]|uniref:oligosaccharide flippase family protein n=1 Tax=Vibrio sp. VB16 TaxID=2785746 RepID=UPI00189EDC5A|nr:oligosaccharide flippase family protein [Vibrio sp. VB16]UGA54991.1 oligosaccharide flippase family protein [Vibrio sp. VB16]
MKSYDAVIDLTINYIGLIIAAGSGIILNILIIRLFGLEELGVFNLSYAIFVLMSQITVFGVHLSCLRLCALNPENYRYILASGLLVTGFISSSMSLLIYVASPLLSVLNVSDLEHGANYICLALVFFSLNKVFSFTINGLSRMRLYALIGGFRAVSMLAFVVLLFNIESKKPLVSTFLFSEFSLFLMFMIYFLRDISSVSFNCRLKKSAIEHYNYGKRVVISGISIELNARVDVLVLSAFVSSSSVGLYSFVAMLIEGFYQLIVVVKNYINPKIVKLYASGEKEPLEKFIKKVVLIVTSSFSLMAALAYYLFPLMVDLFNLDPRLTTVSIIFLILIGFMAALSGWLCLDQLLAICGKPEVSSKMYFLMVLANIFFNYLFIPIWGLKGAAFATVLSWVIFTIMLNCSAIRFLKLNLVPFLGK